MFEENENLVEEETTENVEQQTTEENVEKEAQEELVDGTENAQEVKEEPQERLYTKEEVDKIKVRTKRRIEDKVRKEYEAKYGRAETVLKAGLKKDNFDDAVNELEEFYNNQGIEIPKTTPSYSKREMEILANAEADEIISSGYDDIKEEVDRLARVGVDNMTPQEKIIFSKLAQERAKIEDEKELKSIGVNKLDDEFKQFSEKLNPSLSIKEKYEMYLKLKPKKKVEPIGSMTSGQASKVKDFYTAEEIKKLTDEDLDNPQIWEAVRKSMTGQA